MTDMQDTGRKPNPEETNQTACPSSPGVQAASRAESGASAELGADLPGDSCHLVVNGNPTKVPAGSTIRDLLDRLGIRHPAVAVELNAEIQPRERHAAVRLQDGDRLEIVSLVGGG